MTPCEELALPIDIEGSRRYALATEVADSNEDAAVATGII
jgi:hypothetical protein